MIHEIMTIKKFKKKLSHIMITVHYFMIIINDSHSKIGGTIVNLFRLVTISKKKKKRCKF